MIRDAIRRLRHGVVPVWFHPAFRVPIAGIETHLGLSPRRAEDALTYLRARDVVRASDLREAHELPWALAAMVHDEAYLSRVDDQAVLADILQVEPARLPVAAVLAMVRRVCGATLAAATHVRQEGGRAAVLAGGFHHAAPGRGAALCVLNDVAIAVKVLRESGFDGRVLVLDLDAHPPDGIVACLGDDPAVTILSLGVASDWRLPWASAATVRDARVPAGTMDTAYLDALTDLLDEPMDAELVFYLAGADPLAGDRMGALALTEGGLCDRDHAVFDHLGDAPTVVLAAGGYTAGAWRALAGTVAAASGDRRRVPEGWDPLAHRTRDVAAQLDPDLLAGDQGWLDAAELYESMGIPVHEPRFLGFYTRHGVEYALSRYGMFDALRQMGFAGLEVGLELEGAAHRLVVSADLGDRRQTLIDLSLSRRTRDGHGFLFIEWMELQDPRVSTQRTRGLLPGQRAPGLGLSDEILHVLVQATLRLGLDGLAFIPAHYHIAYIGRRRFRFLSAPIQGRFEALLDWLVDVPLGRATALLEPPGTTVDGAELVWEAAWMVAPLSDRLRQQMAADAPAIAAARADSTAWFAARGPLEG